MKLWNETLDQLRMQLTAATFNAWLNGTQATAVSDGTLTVRVKNDSAKEWLENRLYDTILLAARGMAETDIAGLEFVVGAGDDLFLPTVTETAVPAAAAQQKYFPGFEPYKNNFVQVPTQYFDVVLIDGSYVMRIFVGIVIARTYGRILNFRTMARAEWWEADRGEIGRSTGIKSLRSVDRAIAEARDRGFVIREQGRQHFKYRPREENEPIDVA